MAVVVLSWCSLALAVVLCGIVQAHTCHASPLSYITMGTGIAKQSSKAKSKVPVDEGLNSLNMSVISWNMAECTPKESECSFIRSYRAQDIVVFGIQECEDIKPRRKEGHRSRKWKEIQSKCLGKSFECIARHKIGGMMIAVFAAKKVTPLVQGVQIIDVACGIGNLLSNKGAACVNVRINGKTLVLVNAHLAAHQSKVSWIVFSHPI